MFENTVKKYHEAIDKALAYKYAVQGVLYDDLSQARSMQFMRYVIVWMLRIVSPNYDYPAKQFQYVVVFSSRLIADFAPDRLPLPSDEPDVFRHLPEYFLEDVIHSFKFIFRCDHVGVSGEPS